MCELVAVNLYQTVWLKVPPAQDGAVTSPACVVPASVVPAIQAAFTVNVVALEQLSLAGCANDEKQKDKIKRKILVKCFILN